MANVSTQQDLILVVVTMGTVEMEKNVKTSMNVKRELTIVTYMHNVTT